MWSIALFPCSYTDGARIIGELSYSLGLQVYTDEMLFSELSERFGFPIEKAAGLIYGKTPSLHRNTLKKEKNIHLLRCTLMTLRMLSPRRRMFYGLHTSLLDPRIHRVLKVLVIDDDESRVRRAMQQERLSEEVARDSGRNNSMPAVCARMASPAIMEAMASSVSAIAWNCLRFVISSRAMKYTNKGIT